jgi:CRP-like cAMP-binding protein
MERCLNRLLNSLPARDYEMVFTVLKPLRLTFRKHLQLANRTVCDVYFLEDGLGSVVAIGAGREKQAEAVVVGNEGLVGLPIVLGVSRSPCDIFMQAEGDGFTAKAEDFRKLLDESPVLLAACLRYSHVLTVQAYYTALANAQGSLEERLARWLLMAQDRLSSSPDLILTHEFLSLMLGVRRAGVTTAIQAFEGRGLISTARGSIHINDRDGLFEAANGLYGAPEAEFERLFPEQGDNRVQLRKTN